MIADDIRAALRQRAEADRLLGAPDWPIELPTRTASTSPQSLTPNPQPLNPPSSSPVGRVRRPDTAAEPGTGHRALGTDPADLAERAAILHSLDVQQVRGCLRCGLGKLRTQTVFGQGNLAARIMFVGEAPGFEEDRTGQAFVGRAGQLLTDMIEKGMKLKRDDVYICNVIKCRPPENRTPAADEIAACSPYLFEQIAVIRPEVIIALGAPAAQTLLSTKDSIGRLRGRFHDFRLPDDAVTGAPPIPLMPTYHPAYLLRSPGEKVKTWEDLKQVMRRLEIPIP